MKFIIYMFTFVFLVGVMVIGGGSANADAQQVMNPSVVILDGNRNSPVIAVYNQSPAPVIGITCGGWHVNLPQPIPYNGIEQVNFSGWSCGFGSTIQIFTADRMVHTMPWVDIRSKTILPIRW